MMSFYNIFTIAKYERHILLRSWFFRIFAILSLLIIGVYSGATMFDNNPFTWMFRSLPSALIYSNMFLLNIFQSVIAVFLATDFLKRDKKLNTSEVLFIRPMTNLEYIFGKTLGLITVFLILNLLVILLTSIFILISKQVVFQIVPILLYLFLVSIPTLVFIIGISYVLMILIKNQPVTFIILLGYIALILFYLGDKVGFLFDYMVFVKPLPYSDIIGFSDVSDVLFHRISYFLLGLSLILFTAWRLNRLPHNRFSSWNLAILSLLLFTSAIFGFYIQYQRLELRKGKRIEYAKVLSTNFETPVPEMKSASIVFEYGTAIKAQSTMLLENKTDVAIDTLLFSINPGLKVKKVIHKDLELAFNQNLLVVKVLLPETMKDNDELSIIMEYEGTPDFDIAYLDNENDDVFGYERAMSLRIDHQYGFYNKNFVLLTKENLWYPIPGIAYDPSRPAIFRQQFTSFDLTVISKSNMLPISQGVSSTSDSVSYHFKTRDPLPQLSLTIGNYETKKVEVEGIDVQLAYIKNHDFFTEHFDELKDTIDDLVLEFLNDFERPLGLFYPYPVFSLVEVPLQFNSQAHSWTASMAQSQPQIVYLPEWGFNVQKLDFKSSERRIKKDSERNKEGLTEKEIQTKVFTNFMKGLFAETNADMHFNPSAANKSNPYSIFPNYFYYVNYITSEDCPVLNYAFESYLMKGEDDPRQMFMSRVTGIGDGEKANLLLKEKSLKQIIAEDDDQEAVNRVLKAKGSYLLTWMEKQINNDDFQQYLFDYLYDNSYCEIKYKEMAKSFSSEFNFEMGSFISDWYTEVGIAAFGIGSFEIVEAIENSQAVFLVKTKVTNYSDVAGMVKYTFQMGGGGRRGGGFFGGGQDRETENRTYLIEANQTKEIQMVLSDKPNSVIYNTLLSENIPSSSMQFGLKSEKDEKRKVEEYERIIDQQVEFSMQDELIVDNDDEGFSFYDPSLENPLRKFVEKRKNKDNESEFVGQGWGQAPSSWSKMADADYYGKIVHSAMVIRSGEGNKTATWKRALKNEGYYDVYVHLKQERRSGPRRGRGGRSDPKGKYIYSVDHADGLEKVELETKDFENGWNLLGSFYISSDTTQVTLSNEGGADRIVADAVKWVLQR